MHGLTINQEAKLVEQLAEHLEIDEGRVKKAIDEITRQELFRIAKNERVPIKDNVVTLPRYEDDEIDMSLYEANTAC